MKGQYFKKDKKVKLIRRTAQSNAGGYAKTTYQYMTESAIWAYTRQLSQDQKYAAHAYMTEEERYFVLNYRNDLKLYDIVEYKGVFYSITRLDTENDYNTELFVYVEKAKPGDTPKPSEILPYEEPST